MRGIAHQLKMAGAVCSVALLGATSPAVAAPPPDLVNGRGKQIVMNLDWTRDHFNYVDAAPAGLSSGDTFQFAFTIGGDESGTSDYSCVVVQTNFLCNGIIRLTDGDIYIATGPINDDVEPAAIVGGTRAYIGIRGEFTKTASPDDLTGTYRLTYRY